MEKEVVIGFYNVENLFDIYDDPNTFDDDFTQNGAKKWTKSKYENKLHKIANALSLLTLEETPLLIGLCEIENKKVLHDLLEKENLNETFNFIHFDSKDERGIDVALLYNESKFTVLDTKSHQVFLQNEIGKQDFTRDILYVKGKFNKETIHTFTVHLPSKRASDDNTVKREVTLKFLRKLVDEIYNEEENPAIIILGDFNENACDKKMQEILYSTSKKDSLEDKQLLNLFIELYQQKKFSIFYKKEGFLYDQILLSKYFTLPNSKIYIENAEVISLEKLKERDEKYKNLPFRTYLGTKYKGGYSDHFPVKVTLKTQ